MSVAVTEWTECDDVFGELKARYKFLDSASSVTNTDVTHAILSGWEDIEKDLLLSPAISHFNALLAQIKELQQLQPDWDSYAAPAPTIAALRLADQSVRRALEMKNLPSMIAPSAEGGVALSWDRGERHAYIEFDNDGGAVAVRYEGMSDPRIVEIEANDAAAIDAEIEAVGQFFLA
jgi:hypothetical protein